MATAASTKLSEVDRLVGEQPGTRSAGLFRRSMLAFRHDRVAMVALGVVILIALFALFAPLISRWTGFDPYENHLEYKLSKPGENGYILGSDANGRDILTRLAYGGRISMTVALLGTVAELSLGLTIGLISGYAGGWVDGFCMRLVDLLLSIPTLPLLILISTLFEPGWVGLALILAVVSWPGDARLIRGEVLSLRHREYVDAARVVGVGPVGIVLKYVLPNVLPTVLVLASLTVPSLIIAEASLSFLGVGVQVPTPSWGNMLDEAFRFYRTNWTNVFFPGFIVFLVSLCLYLVGDGLRDAFDPKQTVR
jgi:peptide/nickel transport system permease protein